MTATNTQANEYHHHYYHTNQGSGTTTNWMDIKTIRSIIVIKRV